MPIYVEKSSQNLKQKRYYIRTYITDDLGRKKQITKHDPNWIGKDGYWAAQQEENRLKNKTISINSNITLDELLDRFMNDKKISLEITTVNLYDQMIRIYIKDFFPINKKISTFTIFDAQGFKEYLVKLGISFTFMKSIYVLITSVFDYAFKIANIENPFRRIGNFKKTKKVEEKEMNILTEDEFNSFISFEPDLIYIRFFRILFYSGMRKGELLGLDWENIDLVNRTISIEKTFNTNYKILTLPKTEKSRRKILMTEIVYEEFRSMYKSGCSGPIFRDVIKATTLREHCQRNLTKAGILKTIRIHDFRHSFASLCINNNIPVYIISEYLGHKDVNVTLKVYAHLYPNSQSILINTLNSLRITEPELPESKQDQKQDQKIRHPLYLNG